MKAHDILTMPGVMAALNDFIMRHLSCGRLTTTEAAAPEANGHMLSVRCPCGVEFMDRRRRRQSRAMYA